MFKKLRIQNFKGWKDTGEIRMAPITLLFGANSSGKSSIGQFLMMLKQTVESSDRRAVFFPGSRNTAIQLGSYQEMVFQRDIQHRIAFSYEWELNTSLKVTNPATKGQKKTYSGDHLSFEAEVALGEEEQHSLTVNRLEYKLFKKEESLDSLSISMVYEPDKKTYEVAAEKYDLKRNTGRVWPIGKPVRFYGFPDEVFAYYQNARLAQGLNLEHEKLFRSLYYLGPLRTRTERIYSWTGIEPDSVGYVGENAIAAILSAKNRKMMLGPKRSAKPFDEVIAQQLKAMGLIERFEVKKISEQIQAYEVKVQAKGSNDLVNLPDVGVGVSQVLPVIVQCFYAPPGSVIIMEQPEIHLHPSAQSALADVVIDAILSREKFGRSSQNRNIQLIIETHSEHFLRRLQRRIAEDKISQENVATYFANTTAFPAKLEPLQVDEYGNIKNWPDNFFGDEMGDIIAHSEATQKRKMQQPSKPDDPQMTLPNLDETTQSQ